MLLLLLLGILQAWTQMQVPVVAAQLQVPVVVAQPAWKALVPAVVGRKWYCWSLVRILVPHQVVVLAWEVLVVAA